MLLRIFSVLFLASLLSSCGPKLPPVTICMIDIGENACFCAYKDGRAVREPLLACDKHLSMPQEDLKTLLEFFKRNKTK